MMIYSSTLSPVDGPLAYVKVCLVGSAANHTLRVKGVKKGSTFTSMWVEVTFKPRPEGKVDCISQGRGKGCPR
jgi:hypothetical protein